MNDKEIVGMFIERDEKAISESHGKYGNYLNYISYNVVYDKQDAEECVNDALLAAWNSIPPHKPENLKTYLGKLAKRIAVSRLRQNRASKRLPTEYAVSLDEIAEIAVDTARIKNTGGKESAAMSGKQVQKAGQTVKAARSVPMHESCRGSMIY